MDREDLAYESLQKQMHISSARKRIIRNVVLVVRVGESNPHRLVYEYHSCVPIPAIWVVNGAVAILINQTRAQLLEHSNHARSAWSASHPQRKRSKIGLWAGIVLAGEVPEEEVLVADVEPAGILVYVRIAEGGILALYPNGVLG